MAKRRGWDIVHRWEGNPIIDIEDLPFRCSNINNAGAVKFGDRYLLLLTIESLEGSCRLYPAWSRNGYHFEVESRPLMEPSYEEDYAIYELHGVLDARICQIGDEYYFAYDAYGPHGFRLGLAKTRDFRTVERIGLISEPDTKGGALFPEKFDGKYARLERPWEGRSIWISFSKDLKRWGESEVLLTPRGNFWDSNRVGAATVPIRTEHGWLIIYYGVKETSSGPLFRLGAALLDGDDPRNVIARTNAPILGPRKPYERIGDVPNLVFSCGAILEPNNELRIYYGAANSCICVGTTKLDAIIEACMASDKEY